MQKLEVRMVRYKRLESELTSIFSLFLYMIDNEARLTAKRRSSADQYLEEYFKTRLDTGEFDKELVSQCPGKSK